ncbi:MAG: FlgD immunoglobulin-like domain containing protein, partial [bacterium]
QNSDEGDWVGIGGSRAFAPDDSLTVDLSDPDGLSAGSVELWFRHDDATGPAVAAQVWTDWVGKPMDLSVPDWFNPGAGIYRMTFGDDSGVGFDQGGEDGTSAADGFLWRAGTTVQYYVKVVDDASNESVWPASAADPMPVYFEWSVLPFRVNTAGAKSDLDGVGGDVHLLLVGDHQRPLLDFENSSGFTGAGGVGGGDFGEPAYATPERLVERALVLLYGGSANPAAYDPRWDRYDVQGAGSSVQREPRGTSSGAALGGYCDDDGDPLYDAILWLNGTFDQYSYADTTRVELATYLDGGGRLLSSGDDVVFHLDANGNNADSTIGFVRDYLGCDLPSSAHDATIDRTLSAAGTPSGSLDGVTLGIYGECPILRSFDRMALASPIGATNTVLMTYEGGDAADNGTAAVIQCVRDAGGGVAVHSAFDLSALLSDGARACLLDAVLTGSFGLPATSWGGCTSSGVSAPVLAPPGWAISKAAPNPFRSATSVELRLPVRSRVSIEVYDVLGRKVRTLADETLPAGSWVRTWDGRADGGERAGPGIYFLRAEAGELRATRKAVLIR